MVSPDALQSSILAKLKSGPLLSGKDIREAGYKGTIFNYPTIRLQVFPVRPKGDGTCRETISIVTFTVFTESDADASDEVSALMGKVVKTLFGHRIDALDKSFYIQTVDTRSVQTPIRALPTLWRGAGHFFGNCYEV